MDLFDDKNFYIIHLQILEIFKNLFLTGLVSISVSLFVGTTLALGLFCFSEKLNSQLKNLLLGPYILPSFFSVLLVLKSFSSFPKGIESLILLFSFIYSGLVGYQLHNHWQRNLKSSLTVGFLYNLSFIQLLKYIIWPQSRSIYKSLILQLALIMSLSVSLPLILNAPYLFNFEMAIYEKYFIEQNTIEAFYFVLFQLVLTASLSYFLNLSKKDHFASEFLDYSYSAELIFFRKFFYIFIFGILVVSYLVYFYAGYLLLAAKSFLKLLQIIFLEEQLNTLVISYLGSLGLFLFNLVFFSSAVIFLLKQLFSFKENKKIYTLAAPSLVGLGIAFYLSFPVSVAYFFNLTKVALFFLITNFVSFYLFYIKPVIEQQKAQLLQAQIFNLSFINYFKSIFLVQNKNKIFEWMSFLLFFSFSEYALIIISGSQFNTFGTYIQTLMGSYRLDLAFSMSFLLVLIACLHIIFLGVLFGYRKKS